VAAQGVCQFGDGPQGSNRVNRGGSWNNDAANCRSANRNRNNPGNRNNNLGFRLALAPQVSR
jgi:formylglycine-generating enzyme required for sulfatase activity